MLSRVVVSETDGVVVTKERVRFADSESGAPLTCPHIPEGSGVTHRSPALAGIVAPGKRYGYDVMVHVGRERYQQNRQAEEIAVDLAPLLGYQLPPSSVTDLSREFLEYLGAVHEGRAPVLAEGLRASGGYILHLDGTQEGSSQVLFVCSASLPNAPERLVLHAHKVNSENEREVVALLRVVDRHYGAPLAAVHDLAPCLFRAVEVVWGTACPQFACQYHFLRDVGGDLLTPARQAVGQQFRQTGLGRLFTQMRKDARRSMEEVPGEDRTLLLAVLEGECSVDRVDAFNLNRALLRGLIEWVQSFRRGSGGKRFPFDHPLLRYQARCTRAAAVLEQVLATPLEDHYLRRSLNTLHTRLLLTQEQDFQRTVADYQQAVDLFNEMRDTLRCPDLADNSTAETEAQTRRDTKTIKRFMRELKKRDEAARTEQERHRYQLAGEHLEKYLPHLTRHLLETKLPDGSTLRFVAPRTNNLAEHTFGDLKHAERRRTGRKHLSQELAAMPAERALVFNLENDHYLNWMYPEGKDLTATFALFWQQANARARQRTNAPLPNARLPKTATNCQQTPDKIKQALQRNGHRRPARRQRN